MGMDLYGKNPTSEAGEYLWHSVWSWHPLADLVTTLCPDETSDCAYWHSNDGDGLDATRCRALAESLQAQIDNGDVAEYVRDRDAGIAAMPDVACTICDGTGVRTDQVGRDMKQPEKRIPDDGEHPRAGRPGWCNGCDGRGHNRPWDAWRGHNRPWDASYRVAVEDVQEFITFLRDCGGFEIK